jgi:hypothetical protein
MRTKDDTSEFTE